MFTSYTLSIKETILTLFSRLICYRCREEGHVAAVCPAGDEPMQWDFLTERRQSLFATTCTAVKRNEKPLYRMCLDGKDVVVLLDSGSLVTLVESDLVVGKTLHPRKMAVVCVHGDTREYPVTTVSFETFLVTCVTRWV